MLLAVEGVRVPLIFLKFARFRTSTLDLKPTFRNEFQKHCSRTAA